MVPREEFGSFSSSVRACVIIFPRVGTHTFECTNETYIKNSVFIIQEQSRSYFTRNLFASNLLRTESLEINPKIHGRKCIRQYIYSNVSYKFSIKRAFASLIKRCIFIVTIVIDICYRCIFIDVLAALTRSKLTERREITKSNFMAPNRH